MRSKKTALSVKAYGISFITAKYKKNSSPQARSILLSRLHSLVTSPLAQLLQVAQPAEIVLPQQSNHPVGWFQSTAPVTLLITENRKVYQATTVQSQNETGFHISSTYQNLDPFQTLTCA
jgi:hypothetical protein